MKLKRVVKWSALLLLIALVILAQFAYWSSTNDCASEAGSVSHPMQAIVYCDYGSPDVLKLQQIEKPVPADDEVLVKVHAASINPLDWHFMEGTPYIARLAFGLRKPKVTRLGVDYSGTVEAVGRKVTNFKPGDEVFGGKSGALAEYVCPRADRAITLKPAEASFEEAAAVPVAGVTALQALRDIGKVRSGQKILINGASGGVGTFAVQIAHSMGAKVTGVCSSRNIELVRSLGADQVIDYTKEDFVKGTERYDVIVDNVANRSLSDFRQILTPTGSYILVGGGGANEQGLIGPMLRPLKAALLSKFVKQKMSMIFADMNAKDLAEIGQLIQAGKVKPVIDRSYPLSEVPTAMRHLEEGHARGKVVIKLP